MLDDLRVENVVQNADIVASRRVAIDSQAHSSKRSASGHFR